MLPPVTDPAARLAAADVLLRYAASIDDRDFEAYRTCFAPDAVFHGFGPEPIEGPDAWVDFVRGVIERYRATQHMLGPPLVRAEEDAWHLRTPLQALHWEPEGRIFSLWGTYHSELAPRDGSFVIRRHALRVDHTHTG